MDKEARDELRAILCLLKSSIVKNGVSLSVDRKGNISFFDTDTYLRTEKMNGFSVNINELVK